LTQEDDDLPTWEFVGSLSQPVQLYKILPDLLVEQNIKKVAEIVETFTDVPELLVLNIIEMYFIAPVEKFGAKKSSAEVCEHRRKELLSKAFTLPITDSLMIQHLRQIDFSLATRILDTLFGLVSMVLQSYCSCQSALMADTVGIRPHTGLV
jgi:hypothetical protein